MLYVIQIVKPSSKIGDLGVCKIYGMELEQKKLN